MAVREVILGSESLINLGNDTITPKALKKGYTAHNALGEPIEGEADEFEGGIKSIDFNEKTYLPDDQNKVTINEEDPTVPDWSKNPVKPTYEASEVKAVGVEDTMEFTEIDNMFNAVFG